MYKLFWERFFVLHDQQQITFSWSQANDVLLVDEDDHLTISIFLIESDALLRAIKSASI